MEKDPIIGILGVRGEYGQWLERFFTTRGFQTIGSDLQGPLSNEDVVRQADVVIFSVPIHCTVEVMEAMAPFSRKDQLWMDVTSLKQKPVEAMLKSKAEVVGLHPMCAPTPDTLAGQVLVFCPARLQQWKPFVEEFLKNSQATIKETSPQEHDRQMAVIQVLTHASSLTMANTLRELEIPVSATREYTSPFYRVTWSIMSRILAQNPDLYADIQLFNPNTVEMLRTFEESIRQFRERIEAGDREAFLENFQKNGTYFGPNNLRDGYAFFDRIIDFVRSEAS